MVSGEWWWWQTKFSVSPGPGLWSLVLGPFGPDLEPDLDLTFDLDLDLSLTISTIFQLLSCQILSHTHILSSPPKLSRTSLKTSHTQHSVSLHSFRNFRINLTIYKPKAKSRSKVQPKSNPKREKEFGTGYP